MPPVTFLSNNPPFKLVRPYAPSREERDAHYFKNLWGTILINLAAVLLSIDLQQLSIDG